MRQDRIHQLLIVCALCSCSGLALAGTVSFRTGVDGYTGTRDVGITTQGAAVWNDFNGNTYKNGPYGVANGSYQARGLLRFDNLSLPAGATLTRATLTLTVRTWVTGFKIQGYYLGSAWDPAASKLGWRNRTASATWLAEGTGTADRLPNPPLVLSNFKGAGNEVRTLDLDLSVVQGWISNPASNQGLLLVNDSTDKYAAVLSGEDPVVGNRPLLTLSYLPAGQTLVTLTREDPEPAASNCPYTGTAVRTGPDVNGDGVLADSEVQSTSYRCNTPFTQTGPYAGAKTAGNGGSVTLQPGVNGYIGVQDVAITNQGAATWNNFNGRAEKSGGMLIGPGWNPLIRFDGLASVVPPGAVITKAELVLTANNWSGTPTIKGYYLKAGWDPFATKLGWLRRSDTLNWSAPGGLGADTDVLAGKGFTRNLNPNGRQTFTIGLDASVVQDWVTTPATNQGVLLTIEASQAMAAILGSEDPDPANRPFLRLSFQTGTVALTPLTRLDQEPRGANCKWGGQATRRGLDFDGSDALGDDEVQSSTYRCDPAIFYVAENGVDAWTWNTPTEGTADKPFATIGFAAGHIDDGGTIIVRPGTYHGLVRPGGNFPRGILIKSEIPYAAKLRNNALVVFLIYSSGITMEGFDIAHEEVPGQTTGPLLVKVDWYAHDIVLRNNIIHDSLNNDSLKINGFSYRVLVEGNVIYNAVGQHIRMDSVSDIVIQDNVLFQDFEGAGRTPTGTASSYIELADQDGGPTHKARDVTIRRNVFLNWENSYGKNFVQLAGDAMPYFEASYVLIENNLMIGNNTAFQMRAPFGCKGAEYALFRNNTLVGDMHATAYLARLNMEPGGIQNNYILFYNNVIADTAGTMTRLTTTPWNDTRAFMLDHNLYWNNGRPVPEDAMQLINPSDDLNAVTGNPGFASQAGIVLPRWNEQTGKFLDGSSTIADVHHRLAWTYGRPDPQSAVVDAANPAFAPTHDIFRHPRTAALADLGAVEVETLADTVAPDFDDGSIDFSGAGWDPADYDLTGIVEPPPSQDHVTSRPSWYDAADNSPKPGQIFAPGNPWNVDASQAPLDPNSAKVIQSLAQHGFGAGHMQVDFALEVMHADAATPYRTFTPTVDFFNPDCDHIAMPVPPGGTLEGGQGYQCDNPEGDCHLLVIDAARHSLFEMWRANIRADGTFFGGCAVVWDTSKVYGPSLRGDQCTSADAGGFPLAAMVFTADEVAAGQINHAIRLILPNDRIRAGEYVYPATHGTPAASGNPYDVPYGGRLRLRADYPINQLRPGAQVVARAMQQYGMILADGGNIALTAAADHFTVHKWDELYGGYPLLEPHDLVALQPSDFEVVDGGPSILLTLECVRAP